jgi:enoyl-CoA hydratase/carnithine racemase
MCQHARGGAVLYAREADLAWITLHRPEALNALNAEMLGALLDRLDAAEADAEARAVILTGAGDRAFCAGADIAFLHAADPLSVRDLARLAVGRSLTEE